MKIYIAALFTILLVACQSHPLEAPYHPLLSVKYRIIGYQRKPKNRRKKLVIFNPIRRLMTGLPILLSVKWMVFPTLLSSYYPSWHRNSGAARKTFLMPWVCSSMNGRNPSQSRAVSALAVCPAMKHKAILTTPLLPAAPATSAVCGWKVAKWITWMAV